MTEFRQITEIMSSFEPECRLTLKIDGKMEPLILTCESTAELESLADLIDGHCRGTRQPRQGSIITIYNARELPTLPHATSTDRIS